MLEYHQGSAEIFSSKTKPGLGWNSWESCRLGYKCPLNFPKIERIITKSSYRMEQSEYFMVDCILQSKRWSTPASCRQLIMATACWNTERGECLVATASRIKHWEDSNRGLF
ncbi:uncharacterized protein CIMG_13312 [Coccidioides immitis RS]|uniref:Uncharacterized protein n=1 Tax=Coccidioides immitis (strain RS) TaxID=246410 RepID=A0A0D8JVD7_COCIM|nr:uncharacterized protein CIMG_13312 [Coccidioides immitis RS]KJF60901.1 hypothetical protein CIMG_13312 [Coccidioides immitis RS]